MNDLFALEQFEFVEEKESQSGLQARAIKTKNRHIARRAKSEQVLAEILPEKFEPDDCWHILSGGDVDSLSYIAFLLKHYKLDYLLLSTWCMGTEDVFQIEQWIADRLILKMDCYVGEIFPSQYLEAHEKLCAVMKNNGGRVCVFRNHSKIFLAKSGNDYFMIESSANVNTNPRTENCTITSNQDLFSHHLDFFNGVKSFNRNFDDWSFNG